VILCHCNGVSDREVDAAVAAGARDAEGVMAACGAGTDCGGCHALVEAAVVDVAVGRPGRRVLAPTG